jgi:hypothetical protein
MIHLRNNYSSSDLKVERTALSSHNESTYRKREKSVVARG